MMTKAMEALRKLYNGYCQAADEFGGEYPHADYNLVKQALEENRVLKMNKSLNEDAIPEILDENRKLEAALADKEALLDRERLGGILKSVLLINDDWAVDQAISQIKESEDK